MSVIPSVECAIPSSKLGGHLTLCNMAWSSSSPYAGSYPLRSGMNSDSGPSAHSSSPQQTTQWFQGKAWTTDENGWWIQAAAQPWRCTLCGKDNTAKAKVCAQCNARRAWASRDTPSQPMTSAPVQSPVQSAPGMQTRQQLMQVNSRLTAMESDISMEPSGNDKPVQEDRSQLSAHIKQLRVGSSSSRLEGSTTRSLMVSSFSISSEGLIMGKCVRPWSKLRQHPRRCYGKGVSNIATEGSFSFGKTLRFSPQVHVGRGKLSRILFVSCDMKWTRFVLRSVRMKPLLVFIHC